MCKINIAAYERRTLPQDMSRRGSVPIVTALLMLTGAILSECVADVRLFLGLTRKINEA